MMKISRMLVAAGALALANGLSASAQLANNGEPIQVTADGRGEFRADEGIFIYTDNVLAVQGDTQLRSDKLTVYCELSQRAGAGRNACSRMTRIVAVGNVVYATPDERIRGSRAVYDDEARTITVTGEVILSQADGMASGAQVVYEIETGRATIQAGDEPLTSIFLNEGSD